MWVVAMGIYQNDLFRIAPVKFNYMNMMKFIDDIYIVMLAFTFHNLLTYRPQSLYGAAS